MASPYLSFNKLTSGLVGLFSIVLQTVDMVLMGSVNEVVDVEAVENTKQSCCALCKA